MKKLISNRKLAVAVSAGVALAASGTAGATGVLDPITAAITQAGTDCNTLGAAVLVVIVAIKSFHWLRRAM